MSGAMPDVAGCVAAESSWPWVMCLFFHQWVLRLVVWCTSLSGRPRLSSSWLSWLCWMEVGLTHNDWSLKHIKCDRSGVPFCVCVYLDIKPNNCNFSTYSITVFFVSIPYGQQGLSLNFSEQRYSSSSCSPRRWSQRWVAGSCFISNCVERALLFPAVIRQATPERMWPFFTIIFTPVSKPCPLSQNISNIHHISTRCERNCIHCIAYWQWLLSVHVHYQQSSVQLQAILQIFRYSTANSQFSNPQTLTKVRSLQKICCILTDKWNYTPQIKQIIQIVTKNFSFLFFVCGLVVKYRSGHTCI